MSKRDTFRYHYVSPTGRILHRGVTNDLPRREGEHRGTYGEGRIVQQGPAVSRETGLAWEREGGPPIKK